MNRSIVVLACAWVLWQQVEGMEDKRSEWDALGASRTEHDCDMYKLTKMKDMIEALKATDKMRSVTPDTGADGRYMGVVLAETIDGRLLAARYRCLPDTIDPRGPKR